MAFARSEKTGVFALRAPLIVLKMAEYRPEFQEQTETWLRPALG